MLMLIYANMHRIALDLDESFVWYLVCMNKQLHKQVEYVLFILRLWKTAVRDITCGR